jgi:hypothetical protein
METDKRFDVLKQKIMNSFGDYLKTANELYESKRKNHNSMRLLENELDKKWEEWQQAVIDCNHFLVIDIKARLQ